MTPAQPLDLRAFRAEVARRVNVRLLETTKLSAMPPTVSPDYIGGILDGTGCRTKYADLIREVARQVAAEMGGKA